MHTSQEIRGHVGHPIIDSDGHLVEFVPLLAEYLTREGLDLHTGDFLEGIAGPDARAWGSLSPTERRRRRAMRPGWWLHPTGNDIDQATTTLPALLYERLDELGFDLVVLYPSLGVAFPHIAPDRARRLACRALNRYTADLYREFSDRLVPAAVIPMHTPEEAIEELEYCYHELGHRVFMIAGYVRRPVEAAAASAPPGLAVPTWLDTYGLDSEYDYDPFWETCTRLDVPVAAHSMGMGWGSRQSTSSYMYNHAGHFAAAGDALCKALLMGGVTHRFPTLRVAFLEGGVAWGCALYADLLSRWEKRNGKSIYNYDPARLDRTRFGKLVERYGSDDMRRLFGEGAPDGTHEAARVWWEWVPDQLEQALGIHGADPNQLDEWTATGTSRGEDIAGQFERSFYFGCEADDPLIPVAFDRDLLPLSPRFNALFSSDIGHWDVPDLGEVLEEAYEPVEAGGLTPEQFRAFTFGNAVRFYGGTEGRFFATTAIESAARDERDRDPLPAA